MKHKWLFELYELKRNIARRKQLLQQAIERRAVQAEELYAIDIRLNPAQQILSYLQEQGGKDETIEIQQASVDELLEKREHAKTSAAFLSNVELRLLKAETEVLELKQGWLENNIEARVALP